jgi:hypothetical protein
MVFATCTPILNWRIQHKLPKKYQTEFIMGKLIDTSASKFKIEQWQQIAVRMLL